MLDAVGMSYKFLIPDPVLGEEVLCAICADVTEIKRLQAEAEENRRLAEEASRVKSQFLATMSHEIRTPMNGVLGMAELLSHTALDDRQREMLRVIRESGDILLAVINDILDFSKIESGQMALEAVPFFPDEVVRRAERAMAQRARERGVRIVYHIDPDAARLRLGDRHRIEQIVLNLLSNAIKFAAGGHVRVSLLAPRGEPLVIGVDDDGIGMTAEQAGRVFERFAQADGSTTRRYGGTGLGLSIVKGLAEAMGGSVTLTTAPGEGASFRVVLPLAEAEPGTVARAASVEPAQPALPPGLRVLAADDNEVNRVVLGAMLETLGVAYEIADGGEAAVAAARRGGFDLLLLDISMPGIDGLQALAMIRAEAAARGEAPVPAIAATANALPEQAAAFLDAGFDDHLPKPIRRADLAAMLRRWLPARLREEALPQA